MTDVVEPAWMTGEAGDILQEFYERMQESLVVLAMARQGLNKRRNDMEIQELPPHSDATHSIVESGLISASVRRERLLELLKQGLEDGQSEASVALSQQWMVLTYALWDENFRKRIADAAGVAKNDVAIDALGDLRHMRHDIAHHLGIASKGHSARCVEFQWFDVGDVVFMGPQREREFVSALPGYRRVMPRTRPPDEASPGAR